MSLPETEGQTGNDPTGAAFEVVDRGVGGFAVVFGALLLGAEVLVGGVVLGAVVVGAVVVGAVVVGAVGVLAGEVVGGEVGPVGGALLTGIAALEDGGPTVLETAGGVESAALVPGSGAAPDEDVTTMEAATEPVIAVPPLVREHPVRSRAPTSRVIAGRIIGRGIPVMDVR